MTISTTKYNEVNPKDIKKMIEAGAKIIKSPYAMGVYIDTFYIDGKPIKIYSDDEIIINNVQLPLSVNGIYDCTITIN